MVRVGHLSALIDVRPLLRGVLRYENLRVEDAAIVLERDKTGVGNWKFPGGGLGGGFAIVPKNRTQFPTLIDFALAGGLVTYRTSSGAILRIAHAKGFCGSWRATLIRRRGQRRNFDSLHPRS